MGREVIRAEEENELFLKASLFMFQCFLSLLISLSQVIRIRNLIKSCD